MALDTWHLTAMMCVIFLSSATGTVEALHTHAQLAHALKERNGEWA